MKILAIFDNGGITLDRYTVVTSITGAGLMYDMLGLSEGGDGFSQWTVGQYYRDDRRNKHLGRRIPFEQLSEDTQAHSHEGI
jgi:hypothetical protein